MKIAPMKIVTVECMTAGTTVTQQLLEKINPYFFDQSEQRLELQEIMANTLLNILIMISVRWEDLPTGGYCW